MTGILQAAGIPFGPSMVATILSAVFGTLLMGVYAKKPIVIALYMGENAFVAYTVVGVLVIPGRRRWVSVFISGVLFTTDGAGCLRLQSREECV